MCCFASEWKTVCGKLVLEARVLILIMRLSSEEVGYLVLLILFLSLEYALVSTSLFVSRFRLGLPRKQGRTGLEAEYAVQGRSIPA